MAADRRLPHSIVHLISGLNTGGAETSLLRLVTALDPSEFRSTVFSLTGMGTLGPRMQAAGIDVRALGMNPGRPDPAAALRFVLALRRLRPVILQTWLYHADLLGLLAGRLTATPAICWNIRCSSLADADGRPTVSPMVRVLARLSRWPSLVISNSQAGVQLHTQHGYKPRRWLVIPNGVDAQAYRFDPVARHVLRARLGIPPSAGVVGMVARYDPVKGFDTFFRAASVVAAARPDVHFVLAGSGVTPGNPRIAELLAACAVPAERLHLVGEQAPIAPWYSAFDIAASCSLGEGFPNVVVEAMACEVPCVVTDVGDSAEIVANTGLVSPPGDAAQVAAHWNALLALEPGQRRTLGAQARARVLSTYSIEGMVQTYAETYRTLALGVTSRRP